MSELHSRSTPSRPFDLADDKVSLQTAFVRHFVRSTVHS